MAYTFKNANLDGTENAIITSGQVGAIFTSVTIDERLNGDTEFAKVWVSSDADVTAYLSLASFSAYEHTIFLSASDADAVGDLTGSEVRYGALKVVSSLATAITVEEPVTHTLARVGDTIVVENKPYVIDTITDNLDGTLDITATIDFVTLPLDGDFISTTFSISLVTGVYKSFWRERKVPASSAWSGSNVTVDILIGN